jgi:hypothetical protein
MCVIVRAVETSAARSRWASSVVIPVTLTSSTLTSSESRSQNL